MLFSEEGTKNSYLWKQKEEASFFMAFSASILFSLTVIGVNVRVPKNACRTCACKIGVLVAVLHAGQGGDGGKGTGMCCRCGC